MTEASGLLCTFMMVAGNLLSTICSMKVAMHVHDIAANLPFTFYFKNVTSSLLSAFMLKNVNF
jgi:hypothetical protein